MDPEDQKDIIRKVKTSGPDDEAGDDVDLDLGDKGGDEPTDELGPDDLDVDGGGDEEGDIDLGEGDSRFGPDEKWNNGDPQWENKMREGLDNSDKSSIFVSKTKILTKLKENFMTEEPQVEPQVQPEVAPEKPSRKTRTWQPNHEGGDTTVNPTIAPKANNDSGSSESGIINDDIVAL